MDKKVGLTPDEIFKWNSDFIYYTVREPFPSNCTSANFVFGKIDHNHPFKVSSHMPEDRVIFSDGMEDDYLEFNSGVYAIVKIADKKGFVVV